MLVAFALPISVLPIAQVDDFYYPFLVSKRGNCNILVKDLKMLFGQLCKC